MLDKGAINQEEFNKIKHQIFNDEEIIEPSIAPKSNDTIIPDFSIQSYKVNLKQISVGSMLTAHNNFNKGDLAVLKDVAYRYTAHYANSYQIIIDGKMHNLSETEFVYIFLKVN